MLAAMIRDWAQHQFGQPSEPSDLHDRLLRIVEPPLLEAVLQRNRGQFLAAAPANWAYTG